MFVQQIGMPKNKTNFTGKFSAETLAICKKIVASEDYKTMKSFRAGKSVFTNIDLKRIKQPIQDEYGKINMEDGLFAIISNSRSKKEPIKIKLGDDEMPISKLLFARISNACVRAEELLK